MSYLSVLGESLSIRANESAVSRRQRDQCSISVHHSLSIWQQDVSIVAGNQYLSS